MALNSLRYPLKQVGKRGLAAQAAAAKKNEGSQNPEVECTLLPNKLMVNNLDLQGPLSRVSIVFGVGPRNETHRNFGMVHQIRSMAGFGTDSCSGFAIWKNIKHNGGQIYCTGDRETTGFHLIAPRHKVLQSLKFFAAMVSSPAFKSWEVRDNAYRMKYEIGGLSPQVKVIESLHAAAYRTGLGNSLFIPQDRIGMYSSSALQSFYKSGFTANKASLTGYNILQCDLLEFARSLDLMSNELSPGNSKYFSGECRHNIDSYFAHVAVATEGVGMKDVKEALTFCVLQHAYGVSPSITWGGSPSPIYKATHPNAPDAGVSCLNFSYSDSGLFGFMVSSSADTAGAAVKEAAKVLRSGTVSDADFKRAKAMVKMNVLSNSEVSENLVEDMSIQSLMGGVVVPGPVLAEAVDKISLADVQKAAKKVASGKYSMAAYGGLQNVPYLDEL